jgi:hypothetical protein
MAQIKMAVVVDALPGKIHPLVATPRGLSQWWAADVTENDGAVDFGFFKRSTIYRLKLERSVTPQVTEWRCLTGQEWAGTRLSFDLKENNGKTLLRFSHADWKAETDYFVMCTATCGELM